MRWAETFSKYLIVIEPVDQVAADIGTHQSRFEMRHGLVALQQHRRCHRGLRERGRGILGYPWGGARDSLRDTWANPHLAAPENQLRSTRWLALSRNL